MKKRLVSFALALVMSLTLSIPALAAGTSPFADVSTGAWYYADVSAAYAAGLFTGKSASIFDPAGNLSLAELVNILYNALPPEQYEAVNDVENNAIPDVRLSYACGEAVYAFYCAGILTGSDSAFQSLINGSGYFYPRSNIKRSEVAAILNRVLNPGQRKTVSMALPELPSQDAELTEENVMALLDNLDPDGAWIIRSVDASKNGDFYINGVLYEDTPTNFMIWLFPEMLELKSLGELPYDVGSTVHETCPCHGFTHRNIYNGYRFTVMLPDCSAANSAFCSKIFRNSDF